MKKSLIVSSLIFISSLAFGADSIDEAFKNGTVSGSLEVYGAKTDNKGGNPDQTLLSGSVGLGYETDSFNGFSAKVGFLGVHVFDESNGGADDVEAKSIMQEANIKYETDNFSFTAGRQELNLEWMTDYHEAYIAQIKAIENTSILLGYSDKFASADADEISDGFSKTNGKKGIYVADVIYTGLRDTLLNPYYYNAPDMGELYGLKAGYYMDDIELFAQYAVSKEDVNSTYEDGSIFHIKADSSLLSTPITLGYIKTNKDGVGSIISNLELGDNINPFEEGNYVYDEDAKTIYGSISYSIDDINLGALYGETKYGSDKERELNLSAEIEIIDDVLELGLLYVNIDAQDSDDDYQKFIVEVEYSF